MSVHSAFMVALVPVNMVNARIHMALTSVRVSQAMRDTSVKLTLMIAIQTTAKTVEFVMIK